MKRIVLVIALVVLSFAAGAVAEVFPATADSWTESSTTYWSAIYGTTPVLTTDAMVGSKSITSNQGNVWPWEVMTRFNLSSAGVTSAGTNYSLSFWYKVTSFSTPWPIINLNDGYSRRTRWYLGTGYGIKDDLGNDISLNTWQHWTLTNANKTYSEAGFDPNVLWVLDFDLVHPAGTQVWIDGLTFDNGAVAGPPPAKLDADVNEDWYVNMIDLALVAEDWLKPIGPNSVVIADYPWDGALPGYYVTSIKALNPGNVNLARLGMYTFNANGTLSVSYWQWLYPGAGTEYTLSDRTVGDVNVVVPEPPNNADETKKVVGHTEFLGGTGTLDTVTGTYTIDKRKLDISFSDGSWEKWYLTWEEPNNLYKFELYAASYIKSGTVSWVTESAGAIVRDANAHSAGWMLGSKNYDFSYAVAPKPAFMMDHVGCSLGYYASTGLDALQPLSLAGFPSVGNWTNNNVIRYCYENSGWVYAYFTSPVSNPGILARRTMYQSSHDFGANGHIEDDAGHMMSGLQIIDNSGKYRGSVLVQYYTGAWIEALYWGDDYYGRLGINTTEGVQHVMNFDNVDPEIGRPDPSTGWAFGGPVPPDVEDGLVVTDPCVSAPYSMALSKNAIMSYDFPSPLKSGRIGYKLFLRPNPGSGNNYDVVYLGKAAGIWQLLTVMGKTKIQWYHARPGDTETGFFDGVITTGVWHSIDWAFDHAKNEVTLYVDGEDRGTGTFPPGVGADPTGALMFPNTPGYLGSDDVDTRFYDDFVIGQLWPDTCRDMTVMGYYAPRSDINNDCEVNLLDLAILGEYWLGCNDPANSNCLL